MNRPGVRWALFLLLLCSLSGCQPEQSAAPDPGPPQVTVAEVLVAPIVEWDSYTGRLDPIETVEVRSRVSGYLNSLHFNEGDLVEQGQLLAIIDPKPFEADLAQAEAQVEEARARLAESDALLKQAEAEEADAQAQVTLKTRQRARMEQLFEQSAVSQDDVDIAVSEELQAKASLQAANAQIESAKAGIETSKASIVTAEANVKTARLNVTYTQIRSPIDGRISSQLVTQGNLISGGNAQSTLMTTIVSLKPIHCYFDADEQAVLKYMRLLQSDEHGGSRDDRNPVYLSLIDEEGYPHQGHMDFVDNRLDPNTGTMRARAIFANEDGLLVPGLFADVRVPGTRRYDAKLIPDAAIGSDQASKFVYVVDDQNKINRRVVKPGPIKGGLRVIRDGLDGSETVVTKGVQRVFPGATVAPQPETLILADDGDLPNDYSPVPEEERISRPPTAIPDGLEAITRPAGTSTGSNSGGN
ncbi:efflux RND transporter periplasmic adaptor subunit [Rubinisphaera margarita]|uniref:efflux RND transporter periplasmic adaptor subunit n=1 Tax=Rubinisphaera margarita TaxID=2909586 RepID=UPI001EE894FB|nr:efflux RND transporter periplasmic adaptor subunit [Rubinisphaera margarita]MCG6154194.1 efflux RND transporter periplasmic adaptor subunit [Rubinisphaera margarita]